MLATVIETGTAVLTTDESDIPAATASVARTEAPQHFFAPQSYINTNYLHSQIRIVIIIGKSSQMGGNTKVEVPAKSTTTKAACGNALVLSRLNELYREAFAHDGFAEIRVEIRILRRGQKEVILHCGKQYRYVVDYVPQEAQDQAGN